MNDDYSDIINLEHETSRPRMSLMARAAQFAPFSALTGFDDSISEAGFFNEQKMDMEDYFFSINNQDSDIVEV